jgi:glycosyltransferase involved in cell wall biosynthesis
MRIALISAGAGPRFYCENCSRDGSLPQALSARGHEVLVASMYLPSPAAPFEPGAPTAVFYGAINLYLRHYFPALRSAPPWVGRLLDAPILLKLAGLLSGSTAAAGLEEVTLSMLRGEEEGSRGTELDRLLVWLKAVRPDIVHLSNCLLLGTARRIRRETGVPLLCSLQDEDTWIEGLGEPGAGKAWRLLRERAKDVDLFVPVSAFYARFMSDRMAIPHNRLSVVPIGINIEGFSVPDNEYRSGPPVLGYLSHVAQSMGADTLADAFILLAREGGLPGLRLRYMGGSTAADRPVLRSIRRRLSRAGLLGSVDFCRSFGPRERARFLAGLTALSVPVRGGEAFGTFLLEAMAAGVPVVQPRLGGFAELLADTGGGVLYEPNTADALAAALRDLLANRDRARRLGRRGRDAVLARYTTAGMAEALETAYGRALALNLSASVPFRSPSSL